MGKVIITGGNGFIGSHIVRLFYEKGNQVTCLVRKASNLDAIKDIPVEYKYGDICDPKTLMEAFYGHDFVIHTAAYVKDWGEYKKFYQVNVEGTLNVLRACQANGITDVIMTGTNSVYGEENSIDIKDEEFPYHSHYRYFLDGIFPCQLNHYRDTKCLAVQKATDFALREKMNLTILEPVWVYGENGYDTIFIQYLRSIEQGVHLSPGSRRNKFHVVYVKDVAQAHYSAFCKRLKGVNRFIIGGSQCDYMDETLSEFCKYAGLPKPTLLPRWMAYPVGFFMELFYTVFGVKNPPLMTRGRVNMFYDNIEYSTVKAKQVLGFESHCTLEEGIKNTVEWYRKHRHSL
ncbi:MAG: NAD-dependent epimerase/dehydratase family protein [Candidatus Omnitrophica bacterium]|nr:NAD-dependent epimerase/dehydratase family protein [Candidatus Omnitrophota bacterium]